MSLFGGIEGGGTKFVCAVGSGPNEIIEEARFPTTTPDETTGKAIHFFKKYLDGPQKITALGVATFGPIDPGKSSPTYGHILPTPKAGWSNYDIVSALKKELELPIHFDTDVNGAALAEAKWGAGKGCDTVLYITIGTGIGGGLYINGSLSHGLLHPEMGHIRIPHDLSKDPFKGSCPFHTDCFEGLAAGPSIEKRWGQKAETLPKDHPAWDIETDHIANALANYILTISPQKIIVGGGVAQQEHILPMVHSKVLKVLNGYVQSEQITKNISSYIVLPELGNMAGVLGALALPIFANG
jgi:fructokinase